MKATSPPLPDAEARRQAVTIFDRNLIVTAGAGTGKTSLLVERALNLIGRGKFDIASMALITFTEKAASELRSRLAEGLERLFMLARDRVEIAVLDRNHEGDRAYEWLRFRDGVDPDELKDRALAGLQGLDAAQVSTIHAFCAEILRRAPRQAGVDPSFQVDDGPLFERLFSEERERFLTEELGPRSGRGDLWRGLLRRPGALREVEDLARRLASFAFPSEALADGQSPGAAPAATRLRGDLEAARDRIAGLVNRVHDLTPTYQKVLPSIIVFLDAFLRGGVESMAGANAPMTLDEFLAQEIGEPGKRMTGADPAEVKEAARRAQAFVAALQAIDDRTVARLLDAARPLAARARERMLSAGFVSFDALLRLSRDLFARHPGIRGAFASRCRTLLVDEFQDTDPLQYEILFFLAGDRDSAATDAYGVALAPGRLFIVGDPKQSIYRFRGADIEAYRRAVARVEACGGLELRLTASFRSPPEVIVPINRIFAPLIGPVGDGDDIYEPHYIPIESARGPADGGGPRVEIWTIDAEGTVDTRRRAEAEAIAAWIADRAGDGAGSGKACHYGEVALLLRALTNAGIYAQALRRAGIPFLVEGGKEFYERPEIGDLVSFLRAAANPNDTVSLLALLRSPLGGTPDTELARHAAAGGRLEAPIPAVDPGLFPNLARTLALLQRFRAGMRGKATDTIVREALAWTPLALLHAATFEGAQRVANLRKLVARAEQLAHQGLSLEETLRAIEDESDGARSEGESPLADETVRAVRILSVHKAKGLEYPVVFVPDLGRERHTPGPPATRAAWLEDGGAGTLAVELADGRTNAVWVRHRELARRHGEAEEKRVFYVACTRAAERLILVNSSRQRKAPWRDALRAIGYRPADGQADGELFAEGTVLHRLVTPGGVPTEKRDRALDPGWRTAAAEFERVSAAAAAGAVAPIASPAGAGDRTAASIAEPPLRTPASEGRPAAPDRELARLAGTVVHAALESWDFRDPAALRDAASREARRAVPESAPSPVNDPGRLRALEHEVMAIVDSFLASPLPARLSRLEIVGRELPILFRDPAGVAWSGACDLLYREDDGTLVVADYKTDRVAGDPRQFGERYRPQIELYAEAIRRSFPGQRVRGEVLLIRNGTAVHVDVEGLTPQEPRR